eukprot:675778-Prorocentrum_minimum.AAC.1
MRPPGGSAVVTTLENASRSTPRLPMADRREVPRLLLCAPSSAGPACSTNHAPASTEKGTPVGV